MIDLSFLTEEEQEIIQEVLKRDAELKKAEEQRIQNLQKTVSDRGLLRHMTGEWFYETKQLRHQDRIHGTDIIRASMKQAQRPLTTLELMQVFSEKLPVVSRENEEVIVPPVSCSIFQVVHGQHNSERSFTANSPNHVPWEMVRDAPKPVVQSPPKQRKNPFDSEAEDKNSHLLNETMEGPLASYEGYTPAVDLRADLHGSTNMHNASVPPPAAENTAVSISRQDCPAEVDRPGGGENNTRLPAPSSTDLPAHLEPQNPAVHVSSTETWKDRKQVRLSSTDAPTRVAGWRDGEEAGEERTLDMDRIAPAEAENGDLEKVRLDPPTHSQSAFDKELNGKNQEQGVARHQLLDEFQSLTDQGVSSTEEDSGNTVRSETEEVCRSQDGKAADVQPGYKVHQLPEQSLRIYMEAKQPCEHSKNARLFHVSDRSEQKFLGLFRDGNDKTKEEENTKSLDEAAMLVEVGTVQVTLFKETATSADGEASHGPVLSSDSSQMKMTVMNTTDAAPGRNDLPQEDCEGLDSSGEDGVYRAKPIVIYETDDSLTESQPQDNIFASVLSSQAFHNPSEEGNHSAPLPFFAVDSTTVEVSEQRDEEQTKHAPVASTFLSTPLVDSREMPEREGQTSPPKTSYSFSRSPERSPLSSPDHQHQVKAHTQERPPSPGQSYSPKPKHKKEEVRRSPSKTCHPRVLPRESTSPQTPRLPGSPLKTFPINIDPQTPEEHHGRPTPVPRQRRSPSHQAKQAVLPDTRNISDVPSSASSAAHAGSSAALQPMKVSEKSPPSLARSCIPQDYQHYLGPQEKAFVPSFYPEKSTFADSSDPTEATRSGVQVMAGNLNQDYQEASGPVKSPAKRMSSSKSMENLISQSGEERNKDNSKEHMNKSVDEDSQQMKTSLSVPLLQLEETDSDSTFEPNLKRRNTSSSVSNFSLSSGMNSMSSISSSISSIFPADVGDLEVQGCLQFAVNYIQKLGEFHVFVVNCRDLAVADVKKNRSDPYVKCYLLPDKLKLGKRKTAVKKKTSHPTFNEILRFKIPLEVLKTQNLNMSVWHNDTFGRNSFLGEVDVDLSEWDFSNTHINEYALQARASAHPSSLPDQHLMDNRGHMRVAVRFLPQTSHSKRTSRMETGEVQIWVKDCKNLPPVRGITIDPFVKCTVLPDTSRKSRQKTRVVKRTASPMFNHTMVYDGFRTEDLREACVEITVWDHDRLHHHFIGGLRLGLGTGKSYGVDVAWMDSTPDEADLWQRMLQSDGEWVEDILPLRMLMMAKCK